MGRFVTQTETRTSITRIEAVHFRQEIHLQPANWRSPIASGDHPGIASVLSQIFLMDEKGLGR
jgi:hypothetical protein